MVKSISALGGLMVASLMASVVSAQQEMVLWPSGLPADALAVDEGQIEELRQAEAADASGHIRYVETPALIHYPAPDGTDTGCAVIVCPGGGYNVLAWQHEGVEVAEWLNSVGISAFVLRYRVPRRDPDRIHHEPLQDIQRAIRLVRHRAEASGIRPNRIGVLGFSAGGHLTVMAGLQSETVTYEPVDEIDGVSARPDFICPIYAAYLGPKYRDDVAELGELVNVTSTSPPAFIAVTWDDRYRGAQAALLFSRFREHDVPAELHVFARGGHGYGLRESDKPVAQWPRLLEQWLQSSGFLDAVAGMPLER